jgi:hypothetical protein
MEGVVASVRARAFGNEAHTVTRREVEKSARVVTA